MSTMSDREDRTPDEELSLLEKREEFFASYFKKGAEFARELLEDNDRLRRKVAKLESQLQHALEQEPSTEVSTPEVKFQKSPEPFVV